MILCPSCGGCPDPEPDLRPFAERVLSPGPGWAYCRCGLLASSSPGEGRLAWEFGVLSMDVPEGLGRPGEPGFGPGWRQFRPSSRPGWLMERVRGGGWPPGPPWRAVPASELEAFVDWVAFHAVLGT